jgi:membrane-associated phospholipid phosphatase
MNIALFGAMALTLAMPVLADELDPLTPMERHQQAYDYREAQAMANKNMLPASHPSNADETHVAKFQGQFHKTLPHDNKGIVDSTAYNTLLDAIHLGTLAAFEAVPGGPVKLANPLAAQVYGLEGRDSHDYGMKPAPSLSSAETAAEMVEDYLMALLRDVPFANFESEPSAQQAATELANLTEFTGPHTTTTLFRGVFEGDQTGPFISQFLYKDIPFGPKTINQKYSGYKKGKNFMTGYQQWLAIQNGQNPTESLTVSPERYLVTGRDLASYVHRDFSYQAYENAALILLSMGGAVWDDGNPYKTVMRQGAFSDLGAPEVLDMVTHAANMALRASWFQKWNVHRRLRPEAYAGLVRNSPSLLHAQVMSSNALQMVKTKYGSPLLPMAYPEGSPAHPSYPAGHAAIAGACVTVLKAFFNENALIPSPMEPDSTGSTLQAYSGQLTIGGELNKLGSNITLGRDWAGVHYRSDGTEGMLLGEKVGISLLKDWRDAHPSSPKLTLKKFNGKVITL